MANSCLPGFIQQCADWCSSMDASDWIFSPQLPNKNPEDLPVFLLSWWMDVCFLRQTDAFFFDAKSRHSLREVTLNYICPCRTYRRIFQHKTSMFSSHKSIWDVKLVTSDSELFGPPRWLVPRHQWWQLHLLWYLTSLWLGPLQSMRLSVWLSPWGRFGSFSTRSAQQSCFNGILVGCSTR